MNHKNDSEWLEKKSFESESFEIVFFGEFISESFDVSSHGENHKRVSRENLTGEIENVKKKYNFYKKCTQKNLWSERKLTHKYDS